MRATFRHKLTKRASLVGSFVKTPAACIVEIAGLVGLDFVVLDAEHAPFTARDIDLGVLAGRAAGIDVLVRLRSGGTDLVQQALDLGAAGIIAPHIDTPEKARAIVEAARFKGGQRGYSNSPRYAGYGELGMAQVLAAADENAAVILQIEDVAAVEAIEHIASVSGVDALFIGRADLAVAYDAADAAAPLIDDLAAGIATAAKKVGIAVASFYPDAATASANSLQVDMLVLGSDQSMLRAGWKTTLSRAREGLKR